MTSDTTLQIVVFTFLILLAILSANHERRIDEIEKKMKGIERGTDDGRLEASERGESK